jgi:hypothetical protein
MGIRVSTEGKRGCGYRKTGGIYLVCDGRGRACGKLPLELHVCPTCGHGIKPSRGWTWLDPIPLFTGKKCDAANSRTGDPSRCFACPLDERHLRDLGRIGLIWIGEKFYSTTGAFQAEADAVGISRRIKAIPKGFRVGETWIALAHRKGILHLCPTCGGSGKVVVETDEGGRWERKTTDCPCEGKAIYTPAIFTLFKPERIEQIVDPDITDEEVAKLEKRGITPVVVKRIGEQGELVDEDGNPLNGSSN